MKKKYKLIRRVRITGPMDERKKAIDFVCDNGYHITQLHPKIIRGTLTIDKSRFGLTAEKEI